MKYALYDNQEAKYIKIGSGYESPALLITDKGLYLKEDHYHGSSITKIDDDRFEVWLAEDSVDE
jgi:hypothetical protein